MLGVDTIRAMPSVRPFVNALLVVAIREVRLYIDAQSKVRAERPRNHPLYLSIVPAVAQAAVLLFNSGDVASHNWVPPQPQARRMEVGEWSVLIVACHYW